MRIKQIAINLMAVGATAFTVSPALAVVGPGFYVGAQAGASDLNQPDVTNQQLADLNFGIFSTTVANSSNTNVQGNIGLGGRLFAGYQFNSHWATELGLTQ